MAVVCGAGDGAGDGDRAGGAGGGGVCGGAGAGGVWWWCVVW